MTVENARHGQSRVFAGPAYHGSILTLYTILTAAFTYPVVANLRNSIAGCGDAWQVLFILWYSKQAILGGDPNLTLGYTNYIFYPQGVQTIFYAFSLFSQLLGIPLQMMFGLPAAYNILWLLSFILAGYGTFLLVRYLAGNDMAAFVSGIVFAFSPYHFAHAMGHLGAMTIEWIPFCALFLVKMHKEGGLKNSVYAGIFFIMVALSDSQYLIYMAMFVGLLLLYEIAGNEGIRGELRKGLRDITGLTGLLKGVLIKYVIFACVSLAVLIPLNYEMLKIALSGDNFLKTVPSEYIKYSGDLLGFVTPSQLHPILAKWFSDISGHFTGNVGEYTIYAGIVVLALSICAFLYSRDNRDVRFWALSAIFFSAMALGPILHVYGMTTFTEFNITIPLPYLIAYAFVPFVDNSRTVSRFYVLAMLSLAVLAGYGLLLFINKIRGRGKQAAFTALVALVVIGEFLSTPMISYADRPVFYETIGQDSSYYALLEVPASSNYPCGTKCEYYATIHGKPIVGGQVPRMPGGASDFEMNTPLIGQLSFNQPANDIMDQNVTDIGNFVLNQYNIKYVVLHADYMDRGELDRAGDLLNKTLGPYPVAYPEDGLVVYNVSLAEPKMYMSLGSGWYVLEGSGEHTWRWMSNSSTIMVYALADGDYDLSINVSSFNAARPLKVWANGEKLQDFTIGTDPKPISLHVKLNAGKNTIKLESPGGALKPSDVPALGSTDTRALAFLVYNISVGDRQQGTP